MAIFVSVITALAALFLLARLHAGRQARLMAVEIAAMPDIKESLEERFKNHIITATDKDKFLYPYLDTYHKAVKLSRRLDCFHANTPEVIVQFIGFVEGFNSFMACHNKCVEKYFLEQHSTFFDTCLKYPLNIQQRESIVAEEDNVLVVSSAGSGKTSSIVGKVKYLTEVKKVKPEKILLISYTHKAASELTERAGAKGLKGYTFHKVALDIIGKATGVKPSICDNTDALFVSIFRKLIKSESFRDSILSYFADYADYDDEWEKQKKERQQQLAEMKSKTIKAAFPDMDGNELYVRSEQEKKICFALTALGVNFRYEEPYEHQVADETHSQYRPDFSIHYEKGGKARRLYLEHFGIDEQGLVPTWFAKDKGITYEEANKRYGDGITWKKELHAKYGTQLIYTSSADFKAFDIKEKLKETLKAEGVPIHEMSNEELFEKVLPKGSSQEKTFIRLAATFTALLKSRCESIGQAEKKARLKGDARGLFVIKNIFRPVCEEYKRELASKKQIDFTDAILIATRICKTQHPVSYEYIIVDEFQDISIDRYRFLLALRDGGEGKQARLYCVGDDWQSIYRFSGSDMTLFSKFPDYFGTTSIREIGVTYRFGKPLVSLSSGFIQKNKAQLRKSIRPFNTRKRTELIFQAYDRRQYVETLEYVINSIPSDKSIFLLGRYSFDDYYLSFKYKCEKDSDGVYYNMCGRRIEFLTVHKSKGLEADYVILLQCNKDTFGFPSQISDDPVLQYVLSETDQYPYGEERRLFYVAITRAREKTIVMYDNRRPSLFVDEFLNPEKITKESYIKHPNANKKWTRIDDNYLKTLRRSGSSIKYIAAKMGRSQTSIIMRLGKLGME